MTRALMPALLALQPVVAQTTPEANLAAPDTAVRAAPAETQQSCDGVPPQSLSIPGAQSFVYAHESGRDLLIHVFQPERSAKPRPAILFFFGGGFRNGQVEVFRKQALAFAGKGWVAAIADYRVFCRDRTSPAASVEDGRHAWTWLHRNAVRLSIDRERLVISGGSAGGLVAAVTGMTAPRSERPAAMVLFNPGLDLREEGRGLDSALAAADSPAVLSSDGFAPTIIFHGKADRTIPIEQERAFCARMKAAARECELIEYDGYGHSFYHVQLSNPRLGRSPFEDTIARSFEFLARHKITTQ